MNPITQPYVEAYLQTLLPHRTGLLAQMEEKARAQQVPIITPEVAVLMETLIKTTQSRHILEVGTAIGYSAILFCLAAGPESRLITIERDPQLIDTARQYIEKAGFANQIKVMPGDATEVLPCLTETVDMIFLDGAKGHYNQMLPHCLKLLKTGGLLISDNVLFRGMVADDAIVKRRKKTIVTRMRTYLQTITTHPQLQTSLLPIGDGLAISLKLHEASINPNDGGSHESVK